MMSLFKRKKQKQKRPYRVIKKIGSGAFGTVYQARLKATNELVAVKETFQDPKFANREAQMSKLLMNPNIVKFHDISYEKRSNGDMYLMLTMDYYPDSLQNIIDRIEESNKKPLNTRQVQNIAYSVLNGLSHMHEQGIAHRDIKPDNILVRGNQVVIADIGSAKKVDDGTYNKAYICSRVYRAPELILGCEKYTPKIDVWSLGCMLAECFILKPLFPANSNTRLLVMIQKFFGKILTDEARKLKAGILFGAPVRHKKEQSLEKKLIAFNLTSSFLNFLDGCLEIDPQIRLSSTEAKLLPFFYNQIPNIENVEY